MARKQSFPGFEPLTGNFLYCPNQFLDICLPNSSRGTARIVAYVLRQTLGWLDEDGNPINERVRVSYSDFVKKAGVSKGSIHAAVNEAIAAGYLVQCEIGAPNSAGSAGRSSEYALN